MSASIAACAAFTTEEDEEEVDEEEEEEEAGRGRARGGAVSRPAGTPRNTSSTLSLTSRTTASSLSWLLGSNCV